uniref:Thymidylate synthase n=1 Tax=candidate division WWE3 bacterium TaxID=2053526 RepID=A0A7C4TIS8_UNCKA
MELYKPDKYKILLGSKSNKALCTCWFDPFVVEGAYPAIKEKICITGTLYSKEGVSIILRNLALNPFIRYLFLWSNTPLSNTPFGRAGRDLLVSVWNNSDSFKELHSEIEPKIIEKIVQNVSLVDLSDKQFNEISDFVSNSGFDESDEYMDPISFPDPVRDETAAMPSEQVGWVVRDQTLYNAWLLALDRILRYGQVKKTEYGSMQRELQNVNWVIESEDPKNLFRPDLDSNLASIIGLTDESLAKYKESLLDSIIPQGAAYTYGSRLRSYGVNNFDQVDVIVEKILEQPVSRRACAATLIPEYDSKQKSPPCLVYVQVLTDQENKLNLFAVFRSHDMFKAAIPNAFGLLNLLDYICAKTGLKRGKVSINSVSAHVYEEDWDNAFKLIKCQKWESLSVKFNENTDVDARGIVQITLDEAENKIRVSLNSLYGSEMYKISGATAREIIMKLARLDLLSRNDHYADICIELVKAELSLRVGRPYIQDKPFVFDKITLS